MNITGLRVPILFVLGFLSINLASPANEPEKSAQKHYLDPIRALLVGGLIGPQEKTLAFRVRTRDGKIPETGPKLKILSATGRIILNSDADGFIRYPFNIDLVKENPVIEKFGGKKYVFECRLTSSGKRGIKQRVELSAGGKAFVGNDSIRIWYPPDFEQEAKAVFRQCKLVFDYIHTELGIEPPRWGINLCSEDLSKVNQTTLQDYPKWYTWSFPVSEALSLEGQKSNTHEWLEYTLDERVGLAQSEGNQGSNRFVHDGLSEYVSIRFSRHMPSDYLSRLQNLIDQGTTTINLPLKFQAPKMQYATPDQLQEKLAKFTAGYPLSFVFWEHACSEYGRDLPKRFIEAVQKEHLESYESCLHALERLTGSSSLKSELEAMDVNEAIECIENLSKSLEQKKKDDPADLAIN